MNAERSGDVKGMKAARVVAEMRDIKTDIDPGMFETPAGYENVPPEKVRQQIDALTSALAAILKAMLANASVTPAPGAYATPQSKRLFCRRAAGWSSVRWPPV